MNNIQVKDGKKADWRREEVAWKAREKEVIKFRKQTEPSEGLLVNACRSW